MPQSSLLSYLAPIRPSNTAQPLQTLSPLSRPRLADTKTLNKGEKRKYTCDSSEEKVLSSYDQDEPVYNKDISTASIADLIDNSVFSSITPPTTTPATSANSSESEQTPTFVSSPDASTASTHPSIQPEQIKPIHIETDIDVHLLTPVPGQPHATISAVRSEHVPKLKNITSTLLPVRYPDKFFTECCVTTDKDACHHFSFTGSNAIGRSQDRSGGSVTSEAQSANSSTDLSSDFSGQFSRVILWDEKPVGWIRCRLEPLDSSPPPSVSGTLSPSSQSNATSQSQSKAIQPETTTKQLYIQTLALLSPYRNLGLATTLLTHIISTSQHTSILKTQGVEFVSAHVWEVNTDALEWYLARGFRKVEFAEGYYRRLKPGGAWVLRKEVKV